MFNTVMNSRQGKDEQVLGAITARCWHWLEDDQMVHLYMDRLADASAESFSACLSDLMFIPNLREKLLATVRSPQRPDKLAIAFDRFIKGYSS